MNVRSILLAAVFVCCVAVSSRSQTSECAPIDVKFDGAETGHDVVAGLVEFFADDESIEHHRRGSRSGSGLGVGGRDGARN